MSEYRESTGIYRATANAYGFITPEEGGEDLFVPPRQEGGAWDGDRVEYKPLPVDEEGRHAVRVTRVVERGRFSVVGVLRKENHRCWLDPADPKLPGPVLVTGGLHNAHHGDRAAVELRSYAHGRGQCPSGVLVQIFGPVGEFYSLIESILYEYGVETEFPPAVMEQTAGIAEGLTAEELAGRLDLRGKQIITVDGASSRDFDDAVSLERTEDGAWELGVHIADVSHYIPLRSPLDNEAFERGTSVYFADRVAPMLPIALSNGICSLNPKEDRLTLSCFMTVDRQGGIPRYRLAKSVIRSVERMTYEDCNALLTGRDEALAQKYGAILPMLEEMDRLAAALTEKRRLRGALTLESSELVVECGENGEPLGLRVRETGRAESIIEEFMLAANETVAKHLKEAGAAAVYRVHEKPSADKLEALRAVLAPLGYRVGAGDSFALQKVVDEAAGKPEALLVNTLLLRSQKKARYDAEDLGHFALAAEDYCHFTSPIRRYPDLMVHRALTALLEGDERMGKRLVKRVEEAAKQASQRELAAAAAEREVEKRYAARFLSGHVGETFPGAVSGVTRFGLFVMLTCGAEGRLPIEALPWDEYEYDEGRMTLTGREHRYAIGTPLNVVVAAAEVESGQVELAPEGAEPVRRPRISRREEPKRRSDRPGRTPERHGKGGKGAFRPPHGKPGNRKGRKGHKR